MRTSSLVLGALVAGIIASVSIACGSSRGGRGDLLAVPAEAGNEVATGYPEVDVADDPCDATVLFKARSMAGCRFLMTASTLTPALPNWVPGGCYALVVSNPSSEQARLRLRFKARGDIAAREEDAGPYLRHAVVDGRRVRYEPLEGGTLGPGGSAVVSALSVTGRLEEAPASWCPTPTAFVEGDEPAARDDTVTSAIELLADVPVGVALVAHYEHDAETERLLIERPYMLAPVHLWETAAVETGIFQPGLPSTVEYTFEGERVSDPLDPARTLVLAAFDGTQVTLPTMDGSSRDLILQRGEVFSHTTNDATIGRVAIADKPIALVTVTPNALIPWDYERRLFPEHPRFFKMFLPSRAWGSEYVAVRHGDRWDGAPEEPPWRVIGGADGTELRYEPYHPAGAPDRVSKGELAVFFANAPFVVWSQDDAHPFYLGGTMTASGYQRERHGDLEPYHESRGTGISVDTFPTSLFKTQYPFFAPPGFPEHNLVLVRLRGGGEVRLDCAGVLSGWEPIGERFEFLRVPLTGRLYQPIAYADGKCHAGAHWIEGDGPFWGTVWGWGNSDTSTALNRGTVANAYALPLVGLDNPARPPTN